MNSIITRMLIFARGFFDLIYSLGGDRNKLALEDEILSLPDGGRMCNGSLIMEDRPHHCLLLFHFWFNVYFAPTVMESIQETKTADSAACWKLARRASDSLKRKARWGSHWTNTPSFMNGDNSSWTKERAAVWEYTASVGAGRRHWQQSQSTVTPPTMHWAKTRPVVNAFSLAGWLFFSLLQPHRPREELPAALRFPLAVLFHGKFASCLL